MQLHGLSLYQYVYLNYEYVAYITKALIFLCTCVSLLWYEKLLATNQFGSIPYLQGYNFQNVLFKFLCTFLAEGTLDHATELQPELIASYICNQQIFRINIHSCHICRYNTYMCIHVYTFIILVFVDYINIQQRSTQLIIVTMISYKL